MDQAAISLAQTIAALGATGVLALVFILWITGKLHSDPEVKQNAAERDADNLYREALRKEAVDDRRAADARVEALTSAVKESNALTRRALDLNERLVDEFVRTPGTRTRSSDG